MLHPPSFIIAPIRHGLTTAPTLTKEKQTHESAHICITRRATRLPIPNPIAHILNTHTNRIPAPQTRTFRPNRRIPTHQLLHRHTILIQKRLARVSCLNYIPLHTRKRHTRLCRAGWVGSRRRTRLRRRRGDGEHVADDRRTQLQSILASADKRVGWMAYIIGPGKTTWMILVPNDEWVPGLDVG